ncbi:NlpC/P60 family protein [Actinomadura geliboluensis]|uniref:NlpC/P60 family protein n=1 Tax=Actinomadura geliboluensis TaxID=882440 RepID=UPI002616700A|nr:NlpC/P60 family protein [Actinomadura geliboluensis]
MAIGKDINGVGVGIAAAGIVLTWAGFNNVSPVQAFKDLAMGKAPTPNPKAPFQPIAFTGGGTAAAGGAVPAAFGGGGSIVSMAQQVAASPAGRSRYCWGGGHGANPCSARCFDCSGYVSCVLNRLGVLKGALNTVGFLSWKGARTVPFEQRQPGDLLVTATHIGIAIDGTRMWNAACTACGPVKISPYGRKYTVRRVGGASSAPTPVEV